jgi:hypothetical protein
VGHTTRTKDECRGCQLIARSGDDDEQPSAARRWRTTTDQTVELAHAGRNMSDDDCVRSAELGRVGFDGKREHAEARRTRSERAAMTTSRRGRVCAEIQNHARSDGDPVAAGAGTELGKVAARRAPEKSSQRIRVGAGRATEKAAAASTHGELQPPGSRA